MKRLLLILAFATLTAFAQNGNNFAGGASTNPTTNCIPKKTGASTFGDSALCETGTVVQTAKGETVSIQGATSGTVGFIAPATGGVGPWVLPVDAAGAFISDGALNVSLNPFSGSGNIVRSAGVNAQTGTTYTVLSSDVGRLVTFSNTAAVAVTLPQSTASFFAQDSCMDVDNIGTGTVTITPTTSTIDGTTKFILPGHQSARICGDSSNYSTGSRTGTDNDFIRNSVFEQGDDFCGHGLASTTIGTLGWALRGSGTLAKLQGTSAHWCLLREDSSAVANTNASVELDATGFPLPALNAETNWVFSGLVRINQTTNTRFDFSISTEGEGPLPTSAISIRFDTKAGIADTTFNYSTRNGCTTNTFACATKTEAAGATTVVASTWYYLRIRSTTAGTVLFSVNNGTETSIATNSPTSNNMVPRFSCGNDVTAASSTCDVDAFYMKQVGVQRF